MSRHRISVVALCAALFLFLSAAARADQQADDLYKQYKSYKSKGQYDLAAKAVCDAAKIDTKYQNECDQVSTYVNGRLTDFETTFVLAQAEFNRGNCADALRDFGKISFGPHREEAVTLSAKAKECVEHPAPTVDPNTEALKAAQLAYANNNFATAEQNAQQIKSAELLPQAQTIRNNIKNYTDAMQQGDEYARKKNFTAARQQYEIAAHIKSDGPGSPSSKIQQMIAASNPVPQQDNKAALVKAALTEAQSASSRGDWRDSVGVVCSGAGVRSKTAGCDCWKGEVPGGYRQKRFEASRGHLGQWCALVL